MKTSSLSLSLSLSLCLSLFLGPCTLAAQITLNSETDLETDRKLSYTIDADQSRSEAVWEVFRELTETDLDLPSNGKKVTIEGDDGIEFIYWPRTHKMRIRYRGEDEAVREQTAALIARAKSRLDRDTSR